MLRTNSKKAKENIRETLTDNLKYDFLYDYDLDNMTQKEILEAYLSNLVYQTMNHFDFAPHRFYNVFECWKHNYRGHDCSGYWENRETIKRWLEETDEEADKYDNMQVEELYCKLLFRELNILLKKNKLPQIFEVFFANTENFRKYSHSETAAKIHAELNIKDWTVEQND